VPPTPKNQLSGSSIFSLPAYSGAMSWTHTNALSEIRRKPKSRLMGFIAGLAIGLAVHFLWH
jgi:hypothetical protein